MALIVSPGQNEIEQMKKLGLDIVPHRKRMNRVAAASGREVQGHRRPAADRVRLRHVADRLRRAELFHRVSRQADAESHADADHRAREPRLSRQAQRHDRGLRERVRLAGKGAGHLRRRAKAATKPVKDKAKLVEDLRQAVEAATTFCATRQVILPAIEQLAAGSLERLQRIDDAVNALISPDPLRREFLGHERLVSTLYGAVKPDPAALEFAGRVACIAAIADAIRAKLNPNPADITEVMGDIGKLLDASITGVDMPAKPAPVMDLSKIDFEALRSRFKESKHKNTDLEVLKAAIRAQLEKLIRLNKTRADFAEKFEELIESYNQGSQSIEELFEELLKLSRNLNEEQAASRPREHDRGRTGDLRHPDATGA